MVTYTFNKVPWYNNKRKIDTYFRQNIMPSIREVEQGRRDLPLRRISYNDLIDTLYKNNEITSKQAGTYIIPEDLIKEYRKTK
jgi:hypothetical protein